MKCSHCGKQNRAGDDVCARCGASLSHEFVPTEAEGSNEGFDLLKSLLDISPQQSTQQLLVACTVCGKDNPVDSRFCEGCGNKIAMDGLSDGPQGDNQSFVLPQRAPIYINDIGVELIGPPHKKGILGGSKIGRGISVCFSLMDEFYDWTVASGEVFFALIDDSYGSVSSRFLPTEDSVFEARGISFFHMFSRILIGNFDIVERNGSKKFICKINHEEPYIYHSRLDIDEYIHIHIWFKDDNGNIIYGRDVINYWE